MAFDSRCLDCWFSEPWHYLGQVTRSRSHVRVHSHRRTMLLK